MYASCNPENILNRFTLFVRKISHRNTNTATNLLTASLYSLSKFEVFCCGGLSFIKHFHKHIKHIKHDNIILTTVTNIMFGPEMVVICNIDIGITLLFKTCINYLKSNLRFCCG